MKYLVLLSLVLGLMFMSCSKCQECSYDLNGDGEVKDSELRKYCGDEEINKFKQEASAQGIKYVCITD